MLGPRESTDAAPSSTQSAVTRESAESSQHSQLFPRDWRKDAVDSRCACASELEFFFFREVILDPASVRQSSQ